MSKKETVSTLSWSVEYSIKNNPYIKKRFLKGLLIAITIVYGGLLILMLFSLSNIQNEGFIQSGFGIIFWIVSSFFWLIVFFLYITKLTTYIASYKVDSKSIQVRVKAKNKRNKLLGILDFINTATYSNQPGNVSIHSLGSEGSLKITWKNVKNIRIIEKAHTVHIKGRPGEKMPVFYTDENAQSVIEHIKKAYPNVEMM